MRIKIIVFSFLLSCNFVCFSQTKTQQIAFADSVYMTGNHLHTIDLFTNLLATYGEEEKFLRTRGKSYININQFQKGIDDYKKALLLNSACANCYFYIGFATANLNDFTTSFKYLDSAIAVNDTLLDPYIYKIRLLEISEKLLEADLMYKSISSKFSLNPYFYVERGKYFHRQKLNSKARQDFDKAVALKPFNTDILFERAKFLVGLGEWDKALTDLNKCLYKDSLSAGFLAYRGGVYAMLQEKDKAMKDYNNALIINPQDYQTFLNRSDLYYSMENMDAACEDNFTAKQLINLVPEPIPEHLAKINIMDVEICDDSRASYYYQRGIAEYNLNNFQKAVDFYNEGLTKFNNHSLMISFRGNAYMRLFKYEEAITDYLLALTLSGQLKSELKENVKLANDPLVLEQYILGCVVENNHSLGASYIYIGRMNEGEPYLKFAIDNCSTFAKEEQSRYNNSYGGYLAEIGDDKKAIEYFDKAINLDKMNPLPLVNKALSTYSLLNKNGQKIRSWQLSVNASPATGGIIPAPKFSMEDKDELSKAIDYCNKALEIDKQFAYAFLVRAMIKKGLNQPDYCLDAESAKYYGYANAFELIGADCDN